MKKRLWIIGSIVLVAALLLGLSYLTAKDRCRRAYCALQETDTAHYTQQHYSNSKLSSTKEAWINRDVYLHYTDVHDLKNIQDTWYIGVGDSHWQAEVEDPESPLVWKHYGNGGPGKIWYHAWEYFDRAQCRVRNFGMAVEFVTDLGSDNCTLSRQIETQTFYLDLRGKISKIQTELVTYNSHNIDPDDIHSNDNDIYTFHPTDPAQIREAILDVYETPAAVMPDDKELCDMEAEWWNFADGPEELPQVSDLVVLFKPETQKSQYAYTRTTGTVTQVLQGDLPAGNRIELTEVAYTEGRKLWTTEGYCPMTTGKEYLLFLKAYEPDSPLAGMYAIVDMTYGKYVPGATAFWEYELLPGVQAERYRQWYEAVKKLYPNVLE